MSTKKTITINPDLFNVGSRSKSRTKKVKDTKLPVIPQLISPNILKNKLLERIKNHKLKETEGLVNNKTRLSETNNKNNIVEEKNFGQEFSDEFSDSMNYLKSLSNQKNVEKRRELLNKTIKRHEPIYNSPTLIQNVNLDLPEELKENMVPMNTTVFTLKSNDVPYGVLKNGTKPTYREYNKTQRSFEVNNPKQALVIENKQTIINGVSNEREKRMNNLKEKLIQKKMEKQGKQMIYEQKKMIESFSNVNTNSETIITPIINTEPLINANNSVNANNGVNANAIINVEPMQSVSFSTTDNNFLTDVNPTLDNNYTQNSMSLNEQQVIYKPVKKLLKKTIKRNYTLGKSKIKRTVGVLIKNRATRKKIINAQKELKKQNITDIKEYLREHNLIKVGSNAPNDVLRKMYENSMLAGELTNINKEIMLHNFMKDDIEENNI